MTNEAPNCHICAMIGDKTPAIAIIGVTEPCKRCLALFTNASTYSEHASCGPHLELALDGTQRCPHGVKLVFDEPRPVVTIP